MVAAGEVATGDLQVATVKVTLLERGAAVYCYLFGGAAAHVVVGAFDDGAAFRVGEAYGAVFGVVDDLPDTRFRFDAGLVAVCIEDRSEITHGGVLIQLIGDVFCATCHADAVFDSVGVLPMLS